jgi:glutamine---fructose-6-phosphate transaminase (isomerizing)
VCGIVGYVGSADAIDVVVSGLRRLEYRGYDSAGVAFLDPVSGELRTVKSPGKISALEKCIADEVKLPDGAHATLAIGHTRWATHGPPTKANAHPHVSRNGRFAVVHNGIIENYAAVKARLQQQGYVFASQTDTEVIAHLVEECYEGDLRAAVTAALESLEGTYGVAVISSLHPGQIVAARKGSPIAVGVCKGQTIVASDVSALVRHTQQVIFLDDGDVLSATRDEMVITSMKNVPVTREAMHIDWDVGKIEKGGHEHFMLKEIHEQPAALANTLRGRLVAEEGTVKLNGLQMSPREVAGVERVCIAACGTSLYAGMVGKYLFEDLAGLPADVQQAAEFRYRNPMIRPDTCLIAISQSGETADTLAAVREGQRKGATVLGICNVVGSTIARETGRGAYLHAGPEIGVASTKAFTCQVAVLTMMAVLFGRTRRLSLAAGRDMVRTLDSLPALVTSVLQQEPMIRQLAEKYSKAKDFFYIGRGYMYPAAMEGALKLKEISYIHAEGYHAAELKHGPIALLDSSVPVVALAPESPEKSKTVGNMQECRARHSPVIAVVTQGDRETAAHADDVIEIPNCPECVAAVPVVVAEQLFAYHVARARGCPIDQPRNLAKSVTVE